MTGCTGGGADTGGLRALISGKSNDGLDAAPPDYAKKLDRLCGKAVGTSTPLLLLCNKCIATINSRFVRYPLSPTSDKPQIVINCSGRTCAFSNSTLTYTPDI